MIEVTDAADVPAAPAPEALHPDVAAVAHAALGPDEAAVAQAAAEAREYAARTALPRVAVREHLVAAIDADDAEALRSTVDGMIRCPQGRAARPPGTHPASDRLRPKRCGPGQPTPAPE